MNIDRSSRKTTHWRAILVIIFVLIGCSTIGCKARREPVGSPEYYFANLHNPDFVWRGPTSREDRIPKLQAARALAHIGDPAVPYLIKAIKDPSIDIISIYDALSEIGLPVQEYKTQIIEDRDAAGIGEWWILHGTETKQQRELFRREIGVID